MMIGITDMPILFEVRLLRQRGGHTDRRFTRKPDACHARVSKGTEPIIETTDAGAFLIAEATTDRVEEHVRRPADGMANVERTEIRPVKEDGWERRVVRIRYRNLTVGE